MRLGAKTVTLDDLVQSVEACEELPHAVRAGILAMIRATGGQR